MFAVQSSGQGSETVRSRPSHPALFRSNRTLGWLTSCRYPGHTVDGAVSVWYVLKEHFIHEIRRKGGRFGQRNSSSYDIPSLRSLSPSSIRLIHIAIDATEFFQEFFFFFCNYATVCTMSVREQRGWPKKCKKSKNTGADGAKKGRCGMTDGKKSSGSS